MFEIKLKPGDYRKEMLLDHFIILVVSSDAFS